jgi:protein tyrosine phosphatase (PTP) superfamily phosphohydrolase (DUF442 family)
MPTLLEAIRGVANAYQPLSGLVTGGQPGTSQLEAMKAAGVSVVLDLREPMEPRPIDEPAKVAQLSMEYVNVPVSGGRLDDTTLERILTVLRDKSQKQIFMHCGSGNRVGGALIAHFMLDQGMAEEDAVAMAMKVGLRSVEYLEWGLDYVRRHS